MPIKASKWDIVLIDFPFTDGTQTKKRPGAVCAIVINELGREDLIISAITHQTGNTGIVVNEGHPEYKMSGLKYPSRILPGKIFTCAKSEVRHKLGQLGPTLQETIKSRLRDILDL
ncbi:MAG: type II toxin-antitoxin system PemK/MazF family toxin [bacterium]